MDTTLDEFYDAVDRLLDGELTTPSPEPRPSRGRWQASVPVPGGAVAVYDRPAEVLLVVRCGTDEHEVTIPHAALSELAIELTAIRT